MPSNSSDQSLRKPPSRHRVRAVLLSTVIDEKAVEKVVDKQKTTGATAVIFELEIGVPRDKKQLARRLAAECLAREDYDSKLRLVRINPIGSPDWEMDLEAIMPSRPDAILLAKVYQSTEVVAAAKMVGALEVDLGIPSGTTRLWTMIETPRAVLHSEEIASADPRMDLLIFGPGDYTRELGTFTSAGDESWGPLAGIETLFARSLMLSASRAAGRLAIDMCFADVRNLSSMPAHARLSRQLGFDGMLALSPNQLPAILAGFTPTADEVERAHRIVSEFRAAVESGRGIVAVDGLHVSETVADAYQFLLERAGEA